VEALVGQRLKTLAEVHPFEIDRVDSDELVLTISTGSERTITRIALLRAWARIVAGDEITRADLDEIEERQGTYMAAIMAKIPGVEFAYDPLRLYARLPTSEHTTQEGKEVTRFLNWAANPDSCPYLDEEKRHLWATVLAGCGRVRGWEELDSLLIQLTNEYADSKLRAVPRRLRREAREFRS
jgi:hypothetical protein